MNDIELNNVDINKTPNIEMTSSKIDDMFSSLTGDIDNFNRFVSDVGKQRKANDEEIKELQEERERLDKSKLDFENYVRARNGELEKREQEIQEYLTGQKQNLVKAETEFKKSMDNSFVELDLEMKALDIQKQKFKEEQDQFEQYKKLELERLHHAEDTLKIEKDQFERYKEINTERLELEQKNLEQKCGRFKELLSQFNSNFKPGDKE